jgi:hypothetical protein
VGIARSNILSIRENSDFATGLVKARLREELRSALQKTAHADVESDLLLLKQLLAAPREIVSLVK